MGIRRIIGPGIEFVAIFRIQADGKTDLTQVGDADGLPRLAPNGEEDRQQDRRQQGDDGDDDKQLNQGKAAGRRAS